MRNHQASMAKTTKSVPIHGHRSSCHIIKPQNERNDFLRAETTTERTNANKKKQIEIKSKMHERKNHTGAVKMCFALNMHTIYFTRAVDSARARIALIHGLV